MGNFKGRTYQKTQLQWRRYLRPGLNLALDLVLINASLLLAFLAVVRVGPGPEIWADYAWFAAFTTGLAAAALFVTGAYRTTARYLGLYDILHVVMICAGLGVAVGIVAALSPLTNASPVLLPLVFAGTAMGLLVGLRALQQWMAWHSPFGERSRYHARRRTLIVGAGDAADLVLRDLLRGSSRRHVVGLVDDDFSKQTLRIHGVRVIGKTDDIPHLVDRYLVDEVLIAIPSADGKAMRRLLNLCRQTRARVRTLPDVTSMVLGKSHVATQLRQVEVDDLLRREPVRTDITEAADYLRGATVLITGAGGSIGAELARQIARIPPTRLILLGRGENSIYEIEQELVTTLGYRPLCAICDVRDRQSLEHVFAEYRPDVVFHAAAHKHVPLMEINPLEAIRNNVVGTHQTAELAVRYGVRKFVYISTDKAVKPTSVMGATKRVGEMIVAALARRSETEFATVRFGNVLGSRGSLVPMLKAQIRRGGPVRVTHPDMTRYFMTIPEAVQLILQSGAFGRNGEVFLLDMGEPIRILDLATDLIKIHGLVPGEDIEIEFTGVRPGEKISEELLYEQETLRETPHPKIRTVERAIPADLDTMAGEIRSLLMLTEGGEREKARQYLMDLAWGRTLSGYAVIEPTETPAPEGEADRQLGA